MSYPTSYEIAIVDPQGAKTLLGYVNAKSRSELANVVRRRWAWVEKFTGNAKGFRYAKKASEGFYDDHGWKIQYTGRTQRQAKSEGELRFVYTILTERHPAWLVTDLVKEGDYVGAHRVLREKGTLLAKNGLLSPYFWYALGDWVVIVMSHTQIQLCCPVSEWTLPKECEELGKVPA